MSVGRSGTPPATQYSAVPTADITATGTAFTSGDTVVALTATGRRFRLVLEVSPASGTKEIGVEIALSAGTIVGSMVRMSMIGATGCYTSVVNDTSSPVATQTLVGVALSTAASGVAVDEFDIELSATTAVTFTPAYASIQGSGLTVRYRRMSLQVVS